MRKSKYLIFILFLCIGQLNAWAQMGQYKYKRPLQGISQTWHSIILPDDMYAKVTNSLGDIRIYGITEKNDTIEAPYVLNTNAGKTTQNEVKCNIINSVKTSNGAGGNEYYFTFELPENKRVNEVVLDFENNNYDWSVTLEGSNNNSGWQTILEKYRIIAINNGETNYSFSTLRFPDVKYKYLRVHFQSATDVKLSGVTIADNVVVKGKYRQYKTNMQTLEDRSLQQTIIELQLPNKVPVNEIKLYAQEKFDYYRPVEITCLTDSFNTPKGWQYNYSSVGDGILSSSGNNTFKLDENTFTNRLKVVIYNQNNAALHIDSVTVWGSEYNLTARFTGQANYYLVYGNNNASYPGYDISRFTEKIPEVPPVLTLGTEEKQAVAATNINNESPLFANKLWLWVVMIVIIAVIGFFTLSMMKKQ